MGWSYALPSTVDWFLHPTESNRYPTWLCEPSSFHLSDDFDSNDPVNDNSPVTARGVFQRLSLESGTPWRYDVMI